MTKRNNLRNISMVRGKHASWICSFLKSGWLILIVAMLCCLFIGTVVAVPTESPFPHNGGFLKGTYVMNNDVELTKSLMVGSGKATIDLNGFQLNVESITVIGGGELILKDSGYNGVLIGHIGVNGGKLIMEGGRITHGRVTLSGGTFTMNDGAIDYGSGVSIDSDGVFNMNGGNIVYNSANVGGGVYVGPEGIFNMNAGMISENTAKTNGGGVYVLGRFNVRGDSTVIDNTVNGVSNNVYLSTSHALGLSGDLTQPIGISNPVESGKQFGVLVGGKFNGAENFKNDCDENIVAYNDKGLLKWSIPQNPKPTESTPAETAEPTMVVTTEPTPVATQDESSSHVSSPFPLFGLMIGFGALLYLRKK